MKRAIRWVPARSEYRDWHVPDGASVSAADFSTAVECAECGCWLAFGESYTSRLIHNDLGFGYAVCPRCYEAEFRACPRCGAEPKVEDVRERSLTKPNVLSVSCPACGTSNSVAWGSMDLPPFRQAVAMLQDSWNSR